MHKKPTIVYMGTPEFAVAPLRALVNNGYNIKAVITVPDKPAGRGKKLHQSAVKEFALVQNLKVLQPVKLKDPTFLEELKSLNADLFIVIAFRMLPKEVWQMPPLGTFNIHGSLLPQYRGAAPINWAIINGETKTGVTSFFINENIDTGATICNIERNIERTDNAGTLHDKLMLDASELVLETVKRIENNNANATPQKNEGSLKDAPKIFKDDCKIDWNKNANSIHNFIRGLSPYPVAHTNILENGALIGSFRIFKAHYSIEESAQPTGKVEIENGEMRAKCIDGWLYLDEIQWPGKKKMDIKSFLNGFKSQNELHFS